MTASVMPGAEPFAFEPADGGKGAGVLLVHGYTGTPQGMREWGTYLAGRGCTVLGPRLPGHGTQAADLHDVTAQDCVDEAERALHGLFERCDDVFVGALSFGGAIALDLMSRYPNRIAGGMLVNPFLSSADPRRFLAPLLGRFPLLLKGVYNDVADPAQAELGYSQISTKCSLSVLRFGESVSQRLKNVTSPLIVFCSRQDHVVPVSNASMVVDGVSSKEKELVWLERSFHVATLDYDREIIFERSAAFVDAHAEASAS